MKAQNINTPVQIPDFSPLFNAASLGRLQLRNRLVVAPMTRVSATEFCLPTALMHDYYRSFAEGGFGLIITEGLYTDQAFSQGYLFQPGIATAQQAQAWRGITKGVQAVGGKVIAQLMHAGALSQGNVYRNSTRGPSAQRPVGQQMVFYRGHGPYPVPQAMSEQEIADAVAGFAQAAVHARAAGFDGVEIHAANGYLLDQFLSEGVNLRQDGYGGDLPARLRLICETITAVRAAVGPDFVIGVRISQGKVNDFTHKWSGGAAAAATVFQTLSAQPLDYVHTTEYQAWQPAFEQGASLAALAKQHLRVPVLANGALHDPLRARDLLVAGDADFIALGRGALTHSDWPQRVQSGEALQAFDPAILAPIAVLQHAAQYRQARQE